MAVGPVRRRGGSTNQQERYQAAQRRQARENPPQIQLPTTAPTNAPAGPAFEPGNEAHVIATALAFFKGEGGTNIEKATTAPLSPQNMPVRSATDAIELGVTAEGLSDEQIKGIATEPRPEPEPVPDSNTAQGFGGDNLQSGSWTHDLLATLGLPVTQQNVKALTAWQRAEGGGSNGPSGSNFNWLNTTQSAPGSTTVNPIGVRSYTSYHQGIMAIAKTMSNGYYGAVLSALAAGNDANRVARAVIASKWGTGNLFLRVLAGM